jgi:hypothetical protein
MNVIAKRLQKRYANSDEGKVLNKDIVWGKEDHLLNGVIDPSFFINNKDCINMTPEEVFPIIEKAGMKKGDNIIIPAGSKVLKTPDVGNEFTFKLPNGAVLTIDVDNLEDYVD